MLLQKLTVYYATPHKTHISAGDIIEYTVTGVTGGNDTTYYDIEPWIYSRYIRIIVLEWHNNVSLRIELYGCQQEELAYCKSLTHVISC